VAKAVAALEAVLAEARGPLALGEIAARFDGWPEAGIELTLRVAESYGEAREVEGGWIKG
jgi:hypothetical protein